MERYVNPHMERMDGKLMELVEMAKLTALIKENMYPILFYLETMFGLYAWEKNESLILD